MLLKGFPEYGKVISSNNILSQWLTSDESKQFKGALTSLVLELFYYLRSSNSLLCTLVQSLDKGTQFFNTRIVKGIKVNAIRLWFSEYTALDLPYSFQLLIARFEPITAFPAVQSGRCG